jgi:hypothetical protein
MWQSFSRLRNARPHGGKLTFLVPRERYRFGRLKGGKPAPKCSKGVGGGRHNFFLKASSRALAVSPDEHCGDTGELRDFRVGEVRTLADEPSGFGALLPPSLCGFVLLLLGEGSSPGGLTGGKGGSIPIARQWSCLKFTELARICQYPKMPSQHILTKTRPQRRIDDIALSRWALFRVE